MGPVQGSCEVTINLRELDSETLAMLKSHLMPIGNNRHALCRVGYNHDGTLAPGRDVHGRPLLLTIATRDRAGVVRAVTHSTPCGVDECASSDAA